MSTSSDAGSAISVAGSTLKRESRERVAVDIGGVRPTMGSARNA
jgi:hypothetical protein